MTTETSTLIFDVSSANSVAIKVEQKLRALAKELHLQEYIENDGYLRKVKPSVPETGALDATRKYEMTMAEYKSEVDSLRKLREAAEGYLRAPAYE